MDTLQISKDTQLCISLAARPTSIGTRFHNWLYRELNLDFIYKAGTTQDIGAAVAGIRALGIRGCGVSMPFKQDVLELVDEVDASAARVGAVNTIRNDDGRLTAYNTDYLAVAAVLAPVPAQAPVAVLGSGGMARAFVAALRDLGFGDVVVVARNETTGRLLAEQEGYRWLADLGDSRPAALINATPIGMTGPDVDDLPVAREVVEQAQHVVDAVADPANTMLVHTAIGAGCRVTTGAEILTLQAAAQFALYTGVRPTDRQIEAASRYARRR